MTRYQDLADEQQIGVVFPDGQGGPDSLDPPWNVADPGQPVCGAGNSENATGNDFDFVDAIMEDVAKDQCLDRSHIFTTGFSMGAYFSFHLACGKAGFRAAAPHSGGTVADLTSCVTTRMPMIIFHGASDSVIAPGCDDPSSTAQAGFPASATLWATKNGCNETVSAIETDGAGGGTGKCYLYDGCPSDGQVELCMFDGMDHCWAGGDVQGAAGNACPTYADATALEWGFFRKYAW